MCVFRIGIDYILLLLDHCLFAINLVLFKLSSIVGQVFFGSKMVFSLVQISLRID